MLFWRKRKTKRQDKEVLCEENNNQNNYLDYMSSAVDGSEYLEESNYSKHSRRVNRGNNARISFHNRDKSMSSFKHTSSRKSSLNNNTAASLYSSEVQSEKQYK